MKIVTLSKILALGASVVGLASSLLMIKKRHDLKKSK